LPIIWGPSYTHGISISGKDGPLEYAAEMKSGSLSSPPEMWDAAFSAVPSPNLGLNFDPSHLVVLHIDWAWALRAYKDRVHYCHAKDTELFLDRRNRYGIYGPFIESGGPASGIWWRYRLPGFGVVDWHKYADILAEIGYEGPMNIEHEDQVWGFTTNVEFGSYANSGRCVYGRPPSAPTLPSTLPSLPSPAPSLLSTGPRPMTHTALDELPDTNRSDTCAACWSPPARSRPAMSSWPSWSAGSAPRSTATTILTSNRCCAATRYGI